MKADLLTYPFPDRGGSALVNLVEQALDSGIGLVCITGYTDRDDNPDRRFRIFYEQARSSLFNSRFIPHIWSPENNTVTAFSIIQEKTGKGVTFIYGQNGPSEYFGNTITVLRVGTPYFSRPNLRLEETLDIASQNGSLILLSPDSVFSLKNYYRLLRPVHGVYWDAQRSLPLDKKVHEEHVRHARSCGLSIVPVSNAHMPYFGKPLDERLTEIGRAHIEFDDFKWTHVSDLVSHLRKVIRENKFRPNFEYSPKSKVLKWKLAMVARKFAKRTLHISGLDYTWPPGKPEDTLVRLESASPV